MKELIASLVFDSWTEPIPELRSRTLQDRHLIYEGGGVILDLLLKQAGEGTCVHVGGQLLPDEEPLDTVSDIPVFVECGQRRLCPHTNVLGGFTFHAIPNGTFDLTVKLKNRRFMVKGLSNKEPRMWQVVPATSQRAG